MTEEIIDLIEENATPIVNEMEIEITESIGWAAADTNMHSNLPDRNAPNQHLTSAITGLDEQLAQIKAPRVLYSDKSGVAHYYEWESGAYDEAGYFVSLVPGSSKIKICDGTNIFGVTVEEAGFVGNQGTTGLRGNNYGLVVTSGLVDVRCVSGINEGDYVVANASGLAEKTDSDCGYKVVSKATKDGTEYVSISLGVQACTTNLLGQRVKTLEIDMDNAELDIAAVMDLATKACAMAGTSNATSDETKEKVDHVADAVDKIQGEMDSTREDFDKSKVDLNNAILAAEAASDQAALVAKDALAKAGEIEKTVAPIDTWKDPESENVGAEYFYNYIENGLATKGEMLTVSKLEEENKLLIEKNAESYQQMISSVDKYSVGPHSQAYGLTLQQAGDILKEGMIYIPIADETFFEEYVYGVDEEGNKKIYKKPFTPTTYYYEWKKIELFVDEVSIGYHYMWADRNGKVGKLAQPPASSGFDYWYPNVDVIAEGYEQYKPKTLYMKRETTDESGNAVIEWVEVATLSGNVNNRISSMIRQDVDSIAAEIVNIHGSVAGFDARLTEVEATASMETVWKDPVTGEETMSYIGLKSNDDGSSMSLTVRGKDDTAHETIAGITLEQNDDGSSILIDADKIVIEGESVFKTTEGQTRINGGLIETGSIKSGAIATDALQSLEYSETEGKTYSDKGTFFNLTDGSIKSTNIAVDAGGVLHAKGADIEGTINATDGKIGQFTITDGYMNLMVSGVGNLMNASIPPYGDAFTADDYLRAYSFADAVDGGWKGYLEQSKKYTVVIDMMIDWDSSVAAMNPDNVLLIYTAISSEDIGRGDTNILSQGVAFCNPTIQNTNQRQTVKCTAQFDYVPKFSSDDAYLAYLNEDEGRKSLAITTVQRIGSNNCPINSLTIYDIKLFEGETTDEDGLVTSSHVGDAMNWSITPNQCVWWNQDTTRHAPLMRLDENGLYIKGEVEATTGYIGEVAIQQSGLFGFDEYGTNWQLSSQGLYMPSENSTWQIGNMSICNELDGSGGLKTQLKTSGDFTIQASSGASLIFDAKGSTEEKTITLTVCCTMNDKYEIYLYVNASVTPHYDFIFSVPYELFGGSEYPTKGTATFTINKAGNSDLDWVGTGFQRISIFPNTDKQRDLNLLFGTYEFDCESSRTQYKPTLDITTTGNLVSSQNGVYSLGGEEHRWDQVWAKNGTIQTSDRNQKNTIRLLSDVYDTIFDSLKPVSYKFHENTSNRTHIGFIAQDVKDAVELAGLTTQDFAGYCEWENGDGEIGCGLRYGEFVSLNTWQIQKLKSRVSELEAKLSELTEKNS